MRSARSAGDGAARWKVSLSQRLSYFISPTMSFKIFGRSFLERKFGFSSFSTEIPW